MGASWGVRRSTALVESGGPDSVSPVTTESEARDALERAVKDWLRVKAALDDDDIPATSDPVTLGWVVIACYTSTDLEGMEATASAFECAGGQPAAFSRGIAMAGVDRWANRP